MIKKIFNKIMRWTKRLLGPVVDRGPVLAMLMLAFYHFSQGSMDKCIMMIMTAFFMVMFDASTSLSSKTRLIHLSSITRMSLNQKEMHAFYKKTNQILLERIEAQQRLIESLQRSKDKEK